MHCHGISQRHSTETIGTSRRESRIKKSMTAVIELRARFSIVALEGTLQAPHTAELTRRIQALLDRGERRIVVSLSDLTDIDAAGVGELVRAYNLATAVGGELRIRNARSHVRQLLRVAGLLGRLSGN